MSGAAGVGSALGGDTLAATDQALAAVAAGFDSPADLVLVFLGEAHADEAEAVAARCADVLNARHLIGATVGGVVAGEDELERPDALAIWAGQLPGADLETFHYPPPDAAGGAAWPEPPGGATALVALVDPYTFPPDAFLAWVNQARPGLPVCGGLASARSPQRSRLLLDDTVVDGGAVGVSLGGRVRLRALVSQGCRPLGQAWAVTRGEGNLIYELAGRPAVERIREAYSAADPGDQKLMETGLHVGLVIDEYRADFSAGDFLVRNVLGAQEATGAIAVGDRVNVGQTVQFHVRDADSADADLRRLLDERVADARPVGGLLFTCNGRGSHLFGAPGHDASLVSAALGGAPVAGFFCAGELGPVGSRSFLHGFTASLLVIE